VYSGRVAGRASIVGAAATHVGNVRDHNEDSHFIDCDLGLFLVCDGMGGHAAGEVASDLAIRALREQWGSTDLQRAAEQWLERGTADAKKHLLDAIRSGVIAAHDSILAEAERDETKSGMGTTLVGAVIVGGELVFAHAGDSRAYLVRDGISMQLTEDHTLLARLLAAGIDVDVSGEGSRFRSMLTNALGIGDEVKVSTFVVPLADGDRFLLCSDGVSEYVPENEVGDVLTKQPSPARAAQRLIDLALERGGGDNATAVVVRVLEAGETPLPAEQRKKDDTAINACPLWGKRVTPQQRLRALRIAIPRDHNFGEKLPPHALGDRVAWILLEGEVVQDGEPLGPGALVYPESLLGTREALPLPARDALAITRSDVRALAIRADDFRELCEDDGELGEALLDSLAAMISRRRPRASSPIDPRGNTDPQLPAVPREASDAYYTGGDPAAFDDPDDDLEARDRASTIPDEPTERKLPPRQRHAESSAIGRAAAPQREPAAQPPQRSTPPPPQAVAQPPARPSPPPGSLASPARPSPPSPQAAAQPPARPSPPPGSLPLPARPSPPSPQAAAQPPARPSPPPTQGARRTVPPPPPQPSRSSGSTVPPARPSPPPGSLEAPTRPSPPPSPASRATQPTEPPSRPSPPALPPPPEVENQASPTVSAPEAASRAPAGASSEGASRAARPTPPPPEPTRRGSEMDEPTEPGSRASRPGSAPSRSAGRASQPPPASSERASRTAQQLAVASERASHAARPTPPPSEPGSRESDMDEPTEPGSRPSQPPPQPPPASSGRASRASQQLAAAVERAIRVPRPTPPPEPASSGSEMDEPTEPGSRASQPPPAPSERTSRASQQLAAAVERATRTARPTPPPPEPSSRRSEMDEPTERGRASQPPVAQTERASRPARPTPPPPPPGAGSHAARPTPPAGSPPAGSPPSRPSSSSVPPGTRPAAPGQAPARPSAPGQASARPSPLPGQLQGAPANRVTPTPAQAQAAAALTHRSTPARGVPRAQTPARGVPKAPTPGQGVPRASSPAQGVPRTPSPAQGVLRTPSAAAAAGGEPAKPAASAAAPAGRSGSWAATTPRVRGESPWEQDPSRRSDPAFDRTAGSPPRGFARALPTPTGARPPRGDTGDLRTPSDPEIETYLELEADLPPEPGVARDFEPELALRRALDELEEHESVSITIEDEGERVIETTTEMEGHTLTVTMTESYFDERQRAITAADGDEVSGTISIPEDTPPPLPPRRRIRRQSEGWED
jgi:PPM family protein phosphatase